MANFFGRGGGSVQYNNVPSIAAAAGSLASAGGTASLVVDGTGPDVSIKGLTAGTGITLTSGVNDITVTNSSPASSVTLGSVLTGHSLVYDPVGPDLLTKDLIAGTGMTLTSSSTDVTFTNASPASSVTLASAGAGVSLVDDGTGPALATRSLVGSTGITVAEVGSTVTIGVNGVPGGSVYALNVNVAEGAQRLLWTSPALANGTYACCAYTSARPTLDAGISAYRSIACVWVSGGVASLRGAGICDNLGGVGSGVISFNPVFSVSGATITLRGGDAGAGTVQFAGSIYLYPQTSVA